MPIPCLMGGGWDTKMTMGFFFFIDESKVVDWYIYIYIYLWK